jgi:hypothetical protein
MIFLWMCNVNGYSLSHETVVCVYCDRLQTFLWYICEDLMWVVRFCPLNTFENLFWIATFCLMILLWKWNVTGDSLSHDTFMNVNCELLQSALWYSCENVRWLVTVCLMMVLLVRNLSGYSLSHDTFVKVYCDWLHSV